MKFLSTYHPSAILRGKREDGDPGAQPDLLPLLRFDIERAVKEAASSDLHKPTRFIHWQLSFKEIIEQLKWISECNQIIGHDIEGTAEKGITDFSFAWNGGMNVLWVPLRRINHVNWWTPSEEAEILQVTAQILEHCQLSCFNALYEKFVWQHVHGLKLNVIHDPMLAWHELQPELEKRINMAASILTNQPYWGEHSDCKTEEERAIYNTTDSALCLELWDAIQPKLTTGQLVHYGLNVSLLEPMHRQMVDGIQFDLEGRKALVKETEREIERLQKKLNEMAPLELGKEPEPINVKSSKFCDVLYRQWGFPVQYQKKGGRKTTRETRNTEALMTLLRHHPGDQRLETALALLHRMDQLKALTCKVDKDGRFRYSGNIVGNAAQEHVLRPSLTSKGCNLNDIPDCMKRLFIADKGCDLCYLQFKNPELWTVAAEAAALGDGQLLEDLQRGVFVSDMLLLIAYGYGDQSIIKEIAKRTYRATGKPEWPKAQDMKSYRKSMLMLYPGLTRRMDRINMLIARDGYLKFANGSRRQFLGDIKDPTVQREAYSVHPRVMKTYLASLVWLELSQKYHTHLVINGRVLFSSPVGQDLDISAKYTFNVDGGKLNFPWTVKRGTNWSEIEK